jgi:uncharacterized membrane protein
MDEFTSTSTTVAVDPKLVNWTRLIYALHAASIVIGIFSSAFIATVFIFGLPSIIAVVLNYLKRADVRGTWLESHFSWQIRTFWTALFVLIGIWVVFGPLSLILIGLPFLIGGMFLVGIWAAYRVAKGWMTLADGKPMSSGSR